MTAELAEEDRPVCRCGWVLPIQVAAFPFGADLLVELQAHQHYVALTCPNCGYAHTFISLGSPQARVEFDRQARGRARARSAPS